MARYPNLTPFPTDGSAVVLRFAYDNDLRLWVKRLGAKWDCERRVWWISTADARASPGVHRLIADPALADELRQAHEFIDREAIAALMASQRPAKPPRRRKRQSGKGACGPKADDAS